MCLLLQKPILIFVASIHLHILLLFSAHFWAYLSIGHDFYSLFLKHILVFFHQSNFHVSIKDEQGTSDCQEAPVWTMQPPQKKLVHRAVFCLRGWGRDRIYDQIPLTIWYTVI